MSTSRHPPTVDGFTHASSVIARLSWSEALSGTVTRELPPSKLSASPYLPALTRLVFTAVPEFPFPDASATVDPDPSSNPNAATGVGPVAAGVVALAVLL
jgi:hypothetical protein